MKRNVLHWFILSICIILFGCSNDEEINRDFTFTGTIIDASSKEPMPELPVVVTDGNNIHTSTKTNADGRFVLSVNINEISSAYYILIGDDSCVKKTVEIHGFSGGETNLGTIEIIGPSIPSVRLSGHKTDDGIITCNASITANGRLEVVEKGFCFGKTAQPTIDDEKIVCGSGDGSFQGKITISDLDVSSTYFIRPYATNAKGTGYGEEFSILTEDGLPSVDMVFISWHYNGIENITQTSVELVGELFSDGGFEVTERGFCIDTNGYPSIDTEHKYIGGGDIGQYRLTINSLSPSTKYYVRAYAKNRNGISYGSMVDFTTERGAEEVGVIELSTAGIAVQTKDIGIGEWDSVKTMCESSIVGGHADWRLPTKEELMTLYTNRNSIGGFYTKSDYGLSATYWSASSASSYDYYYIKFWNGELSYAGKASTRSARCVRTIK